MDIQEKLETPAVEGTAETPKPENLATGALKTFMIHFKEEIESEWGDKDTKVAIAGEVFTIAQLGLAAWFASKYQIDEALLLGATGAATGLLTLLTSGKLFSK